VIDLADARGEITVALEELRQGRHIGHHRPEMRLQIVDANRVGPQSGHHRRPAWTAQRILIVGAVEPHAPRGQTIEVRRLHQRVTVGAEIVVQIVCRDEQDVRPARRRGLGERGLNRSQQCRGGQEQKRAQCGFPHAGILARPGAARKPDRGESWRGCSSVEVR
jgi:hypothetical protein